MPNAFRANAAPLPIDRRLFLACGTAAAVFGALHAAVARVASPSEPDPALAAIARHKEAAAALDAYDGDDDEIYLRLDSAERSAMFALADTTPTTHEGAYEALRYLVHEAGDRHYRVLGIFGASLIDAKWGSFRPEAAQ